MSKTPDAWVAEGGSTTVADPAPVTPPIETPAGGGSLATPDAGTLAPPAGGAPAPDAAVKAEIEMLEALLDAEGKEKLAIPLTARVPYKQRGPDGKPVDGFVTVKEMRDNHLFHRDYTQKMQARAEQQRDYERNQRALELDRAALEAERAVLQAEVDKFKAAQGDPEALERLAADQERLRTDPEYRKLYDDALAKRLGDARSTRDTELAQFEQSQSIADEAAEFITRTAAQYPGVDPEEIRLRIAQDLASGRLRIPDPDKGEQVNPSDPAQFHAWTVNRYFEAEAAKLKRAAAPHLEELEGVKKRLAELEAERKNGKVVAGLRATGQPATGGPPSPRSPAPPAGERLPAPQPGETATDRGAAWARRRSP